jgi:uncharacterized protein with GYD domain
MQRIEEDLMNTYLIEASYAQGAIEAMVKNPQDRAEMVRPAIERLGGKLLGFWFAFGDRDIVCIAEVPSEVDAMAMSLAIGRTGTMSKYRTTPLVSSADAVKAMKKASDTSYQPPR